MRVKKICQNKHHPFKQNWYWYEDDTEHRTSIDSDIYCTSCMSYDGFLKTMLRMLLTTKFPTLYGDSEIGTDANQLSALISEVDGEL